MAFIVICCGGGGIPVVREERAFVGVDPVIDKDLVSARLALETDSDTFIIATDVPGVAMDFGTPQERFLKTLTCGEVKMIPERIGRNLNLASPKQFTKSNAY